MSDITKIFKKWIVKRPDGGCQVLFPLTELDGIVDEIIALGYVKIIDIKKITFTKKLYREIYEEYAEKFGEASNRILFANLVQRAYLHEGLRRHLIKLVGSSKPKPTC